MATKDATLVLMRQIASGSTPNVPNAIRKALGAAKRDGAREAMEHLFATIPDGRGDSFKDHNSDMAVGYRNGWLAAKLWIKRQIEDLP